MTRLFSIATLALLISTLIASPSNAQTEGTAAEAPAINWVTIEEALELQKKEPRKIMIDVYTHWCGPCKMMSQNTFTNPQVVEYMNANYYCVKFDAESPGEVKFKEHTFQNPDYDPNKKGRNGVHQFARFLQVSAYPTLIFLDDEANYIGPVVGYKTPAQLELFVKFFAENKYKEVLTQEAWQAYQAAFVASWN